MIDNEGQSESSVIESLGERGTESGYEWYKFMMRSGSVGVESLKIND